MATSVVLRACGGLGPFTWSKTGNVTLSSTEGIQITVSVSANTSSDHTNTAFLTSMNILSTHIDAGPCTGGNASTGTFKTDTATALYCDGTTKSTSASWGTSASFSATLCGSGTGTASTGSPSTPLDLTDSTFSGTGDPLLGGITYTVNHLGPRGNNFSTSGTVPTGAFISTSVGGFIDVRTQAMIDDGCGDCAMAGPSGATVTVTDSVGTSVTYTF